MFDGTMRKKVGDRQIDSFSIFKKGIRPEWEAPENAQGGEWQSRSKMSPQALDLFWVRWGHGKSKQAVIHKLRQLSSTFDFTVEPFTCRHTYVPARDRQVSSMSQGGCFSDAFAFSTSPCFFIDKRPYMRDGNFCQCGL